MSMSAGSSDPVAVATSLLRALEAGQRGEDLRKYFASTASVRVKIFEAGCSGIH